MTKSAHRLLLAIAALELPQGDLLEALEEITALRSSQIHSLLMRYRQMEGETSSDAGPRVAEALSTRREYQVRSKVISSSADKVAARIEQLLRKEAHLSVDHACALLLGAFPEARGAVRDEAGKLGLRRWLQRFLLVVPETDLLQFVETYLGRRRSGVESDWSLG